MSNVFRSLRRFQTSSTSAINNADLPVQITIGEMLFGRGFEKFEDLSVVHVGDQLLRLFAELVDLLRLVQVLQERFLMRVALELLNQPFDFVFASVLLSDCRKEYARYSAVKVVVRGFPGALRSDVIVERGPFFCVSSHNNDICQNWAMSMISRVTSDKHAP